MNPFITRGHPCAVATADMVSDDSFEIGDRVRLSPLGESRLARSASKAGTVVGFGFAASRLRVLLDERSVPITLHQSYVVREPGAGNRKR